MARTFGAGTAATTTVCINRVVYFVIMGCTPSKPKQEKINEKWLHLYAQLDYNFNKWLRESKHIYGTNY